MYRLAKRKQESRLINGGLLNLFNSSFVKLVLTNVHGWADKQETKVSGNALNPWALILKEVEGTTRDLVDNRSSKT